MRLHELLHEADLGGRGLLAEVLGDADVDVDSVVMDSRRVRPGTLFACVVGNTSDGHDYAAAAVSAGAVALVVRRPLDIGVPQVLVTDVRAALGPLCDASFAHPSRHLRLVGVTGTNGKTTTVSLLAAIFAAHGWTADTLGTLTGVRTTPEAPELQARLAELVRGGTDSVAMEVSSHALDQRRVDGVRFAAGVFTNLTQDHLDYHATMEAYFEAKARMFQPAFLDAAVVNADDPYGRRLVQVIGGRVPTETFSVEDAGGLTLSSQGSRFRWEGAEVSLALPGRFNVANALGAATAARALGIPPRTIAEGLGALDSVRGRFEAIDAGQTFTVLVDYAHTPDGLAKALAAAREITSGRLIVVFGAGGDRDHSKRAPMGEVAARVADLAILTSDNPRSEDPVAIIDEVAAGAGDRPLTKEPDRRAAITMALSLAKDGDMVVIAGKGHETGQDFGGRVEPFDDAAEARAALDRIIASRGGRSGGDGGTASRGVTAGGRAGTRAGGDR
ncbi:MAG: UDP-N-acetylmuramoyl-L-alanyl-D-glutamate--2,6-diaminopimelate ligase [Acidimicrobiaceae bacterium]|nr:UDP-N-acetylmuramoyl-L-alanyl-D-glutamate--2,6-diaminopimelate ligase [Acidimicrobiaceae bacterium]